MLDWDGTLARGTIPYIEASADYIRHYHWEKWNHTPDPNFGKNWCKNRVEERQGLL